MMKTPPEFIEDMEPYEPIAQVRDNMRDDCTRRERERAEHPENIMNRVVYDCLDPAPHQLVDPREGELAPYYLPSSAEDCTLVFASKLGICAEPFKCMNTTCSSSMTTTRRATLSGTTSQ